MAEARSEDQTNNKKFYYKFDGDGLRYEIAEFASMIGSGISDTFKLRAVESMAIAQIIERAHTDAHRFGHAPSPGTTATVDG